MLTGMRRLLLIAVVAAFAFGAALVRFRDAPANDCLGTGRRDPSYKIRITEPILIDTLRYRLEVTHNQTPVTGARVCVNVAMGGMSAMGVINRAREISPGLYELRSRWQMAGPYLGATLVKEPGQAPVSVDLSFDVG